MKKYFLFIFVLPIYAFAVMKHEPKKSSPPSDAQTDASLAAPYCNEEACEAVRAHGAQAGAKTMGEGQNDKALSFNRINAVINQLRGADKENGVYVDFWADWCGPCRSLTRDLLADGYKEVKDIDGFTILEKGNSKVIKIDVDGQGDFVRSLSFSSIPTVFNVTTKNIQEASKIPALRSTNKENAFAMITK